MTIEIKCSYTELRDIETIVPHPRNPNTHPAEQIKRLSKIIEHTGFRSPIVISKRSGYVIKGHGRLMAAKALQIDAVPVDIQDYTDEAQEWSDMIADNRIAELSEIDNTALAELLNELPEIEFTGFDQQFIDDLNLKFKISESEENDLDSLINPAMERKSNVWDGLDVVKIEIIAPANMFEKDEAEELKSVWVSRGAKVTITELQE